MNNCKCEIYFFNNILIVLMKKINYLTIYIVKMSDLSIYIGKIYHDSFNVFCSYCAADNFLLFYLF